MDQSQIQQFMKRLSVAMWGSVILWIIVILMQLVIGLVTLMLSGYGVFTLLLMAWNIYATVRYIKMINVVRRVHTHREAGLIVDYFERSITTLCVACGINFVFGGVVGGFGCLYELILCFYVKSKRNELTTVIPSVELSNDYYEVPSEEDGIYNEEKKIYF